MAIKPSPTIAGKLRKLFSNNKQTIEPAIGNSIPGDGGASPVIVTGDRQNNTWSGATWAELYAAFQRNAAGLQFIYPGTSETMIYWATMVSKNQGHLGLIIVAPEGASIIIVETGEIIYENPK